MNTLKKMIDDLDAEITRCKLFLIENDYHHGTSQYVIVNRYRNELKDLRKVIFDDYQIDNIREYK